MEEIKKLVDKQKFVSSLYLELEAGIAEDVHVKIRELCEKVYKLGEENGKKVMWKKWQDATNNAYYKSTNWNQYDEMINFDLDKAKDIK
ncbi:hypothetical protein M0R04_12575 [Candidatus Dojkabacteria bacterium]|jgi:hypothetical protein|nr:hypothetical protein [Candidatus Dojkabacteria bacterium]